MSARTDTEASQKQAESGITPEAIKTKLEEQLGATHVSIEDMSGKEVAFVIQDQILLTLQGGCGQMFEALIVSPQFQKKTTLARHRLVNSVLKEEIAAIHAWSPKCHTPEEWEKKQGQS